jgi:hypothetical protein
MTDRQDAIAGQLRLVDGVRVGSPENMASISRRSVLPISGQGKGQLHVLVELSGGAFGRDQIAQDLVAAIAEEFFGTPGTVTYGLRQALLLANATLRRINERITTENRLGGAACVVLRGKQAFIAQAGWPVVYLVRRDEVHAFPETVLETDDSSVFGERQTIEIGLFSHAIQPGDTILMLDRPMARQLNIEQVGQVVAGSVDRTIRNLQTLAPPQDCSALVLQVEPSVSYAEDSTDEWIDAPGTGTRAPGGPLPREQDMDQPIQQPVYDAPASTSTVDTPTADQWAHDEDEGQTPVTPFEATPRTRTASRPAAKAQMEAVLNTIGDGIRTLGERLLPDRRPQTTSPSATRTRRRRQAERTRRGRARAQPPSWGLAAAIAIPLLVLIVVGGYTLYRNWSIRSQYNAYMETAELKREIALSTTDSPTQARDYWLEVLSNLKAADGIQPEQPEVAQMRAQAEAALDRIDGVTRLDTLYKVYDYNVANSAPSRVVVAGLDVYVLDRGTGQVYHHALNELRDALRNPSEDQVLLKQGQVIDGKTADQLIDIAWFQDGGERQAGTLAILNRNGLLVEYDPTWEELEHTVVGGTDQWYAPTSLRTYDANLYVLDPMANQVFKYGSQSFSEAPTRWMTDTEVDMTTAVDIGIDGSIYILHHTGQVAKYYGGKATPFVVTGVPRALSGANALYADVEEVAQYIYIADASERRIVQVDREGKFVRQLQPSLGQEESFRQLSGLYVDETGGKLYLVAANALYVADLPPVQR